MDLFSQLSLSLNILAFAVLATAIWNAGARLSHLAGAIGDHMGVGQVIMGLVFLGGITELPELVTTGTAAWKGNAALALNNMLGGIPMQTAILVVADMVALRVVLTSTPRKSTPIIEAALLSFLLVAMFAIVSVGEVPLVKGLGLGVTVLAGLYVLFIYGLNRFERQSAGQPVDNASATISGQPGPHDSLRILILQSCAAAAIILVCGVLLVEVCETIAAKSGLGNSFIGVTLLATTTSLPELSTTIAAVRMGAYTMAISNIFGSNLLMVFILLPADLLYRQGELLSQADETSRMALLSGIVVTFIYMAGLMVRRKPRVFGIGVDSAAVLCVYLFSLYVFYTIR